MIVEIFNKQEDSRKLSDLKILIGFSVFYLIWCTLFITARIDHAYFYVMLLMFFLVHKKSRNFVLGFSFFALFWIIYDGLRILPNYLVNDVHILQPYLIEKAWFGIQHGSELLTPNEYFRLHSSKGLDIASAIFYLTWVPIPLLLAIILFFRNTQALLMFTSCYLFTNILGFVIYYSYPAAPPWYFDTYGNHLRLDVMANAAGLVNFDRIIGFPLFQNLYTKNSNVFAAVPSLHAAYPVVTWYFSKKYAPKWLTVLVFIDILGIWFSAVYTFHHYIIDVLLGGAVALTAILIYENILLKTKFSNFITKFASFIER
ncbi:MAG: inositol phosphorylceramide synthase [Saprospiraceae bacterium]|nr:inositol phosphorylceramide synthase [Saprospiraceae bacterium]